MNVRELRYAVEDHLAATERDVWDLISKEPLHETYLRKVLVSLGRTSAIFQRYLERNR